MSLKTVGSGCTDPDCATIGIGCSIALWLASDGFDVAITDIPLKLDKLKDVKSQLSNTYPSQKCVAITSDVASEDDVRRMVEEVVEDLAGLDVVSPA